MKKVQGVRHVWPLHAHMHADQFTQHHTFSCLLDFLISMLQWISNYKY